MLTFAEVSEVFSRSRARSNVGNVSADSTAALGMRAARGAGAVELSPSTAIASVRTPSARPIDMGSE
jgi:hypothetical protein